MLTHSEIQFEYEKQMKHFGLRRSAAESPLVHLINWGLILWTSLCWSLGNTVDKTLQKQQKLGYTWASVEERQKRQWWCKLLCGCSVGSGWELMLMLSWYKMVPRLRNPPMQVIHVLSILRLLVSTQYTQCFIKYGKGKDGRSYPHWGKIKISLKSFYLNYVFFSVRANWIYCP